MMKPAHCRTCGDPVGHNPKAVGRIGVNAGPTQGKPLSGWYHDDRGAGGIREHEAAPHDMRSPEVENQRAREEKSFYAMRVDHHLGKQMDQLHMEHQVNSIFHDRRP